MTSATPHYAFPLRALNRWRDERIVLHDQPDGGVCARFHFEGSTCGNIPFNLGYVVRVAAASEGFRLLELRCDPLPGDHGHERMCSYLEDATSLLESLRTEQPLVGCPLAAVLDWRPATSPAGCVCSAANLAHKWLVVLQTLHFTLASRGTETDSP